MKLAVIALLLMSPLLARDWRTDRQAYRRAAVEARAAVQEARRAVARTRVEARRDMRQYRLELRRELRGALRREPANTTGMHRIM